MLLDQHGAPLSATDSLTNLVTGMGTAKDKTVYADYTLALLTPQALSYAYRGDWIARKVVDVPAFDMTRGWRNWQADEEQIAKLEEAERSLQLQPKIARALKLARLYGGAALIMGGLPGEASQAVEVGTVGVNALKYVHVAHRHELSGGEIERDPASPYFGEPKHYTLNTASQATQTEIHPSRVVRLIGAESLEYGGSFDGWGDSVLQAVDDAVKQAALSAQGIASMVQEAKVDVFKIPQFMANVGSQEYQDRMLRRLRLAQLGKSINQALLMDAEEEYEQKSVSFAQLPELMRLYLMIAAGAADIPATRLLGQSPDGMNATGESDVRNYYDRIAAEQELTLRPALSRLDEVLIRSALGSRPEDVHYRFAPLWQLSEKERAEIFKMKADGARAIAGTGGASPALMPIEALSDSLVNAFVEDGSLPGLEAAIDEYGKLSEQEEDEVDVEAAATPAKPPVEANDAAPRPLYVSRRLLNADEFLTWARSQGFEATLAADQLHVTVLYSRAPVDWMKMGESWNSDAKGNLTVNPGGPRLVEPLGDKGAVVLLFSATEIQWRHRNMVEAGASHDYDEYQPHVTITYQGGGIDLAAVEPYRGRLVFGPEVFEEIEDEWAAKVQHAA